MNAKIQKLETQASSVDIQSSILNGISVFVNGYTGTGMHLDIVQFSWLRLNGYSTEYFVITFCVNSCFSIVFLARGELFVYILFLFVRFCLFYA